MPEGCTCVCCEEWFAVVFNNKPGNTLSYCPLCGYEFTEDDLKKMFSEEEYPLEEV